MTIQPVVHAIQHGVHISYATDGAAALDIRAQFPIHPEHGQITSLTLEPGERALIPTGLHLEMPESLCAHVLPRSGLALSHGVTVLNAPGLIDSDYRGEVGVVLINHGSEPFEVQQGVRIAQLKFERVVIPRIITSQQLTPTDRGSDGFGSTGQN